MTAALEKSSDRNAFLKKVGSDDQKLSVGSFFIVGAISPQVSLLGRVGRTFDPNTKGNGISYIPFDPTAKSIFFAGDIDWHPVKTVSIIPNPEYVKYDENDVGVTPTSDVIARVTFFGNLSRTIYDKNQIL